MIMTLEAGVIEVDPVLSVYDVPNDARMLGNLCKVIEEDTSKTHILSTRQSDMGLACGGVLTCWLVLRVGESCDNL